VLECTDNHPVRDQGRWCRRLYRQSDSPTTTGRRLRQPEVEQLGTLFRQHDVARFQVAMNDASTVSLVEGISDLHRELERLLEQQRTFLQPCFDRLAFEAFQKE